MRYHLESVLPIRAFRPLGGRHSPFKHGMTLEGGALDAVGNIIGGTIEGVGGGIQSGLSSGNQFVKDEIPGGWATVAAIAVPYAAPFITGAALTAGQMAALAAATSATAGAIEGRDPEDILKNAALSAAGSYGLSSLGGESIDLNDPYVDMSDTGTLLTPDSVPLETAIQTSPESAVPRDFDTTDISSSDVPSRDFDTTEVPSRDFDYVPESVGSPELTSKGTLSPEEQFAKDNYVPSKLRAPDYVEPTYIPSELNLGNLYQDMPDGLIQLGYSPDQIAAITSSSQPPLSSFEQEKLKDDFFKEFVNNPQNPRPGFFQDPVQNITNRASDAIDYLQNAPEKTYDYLTKTPIKEMGSDLYDFAANNYGKIGLGALMLSGSGQQPQPQGRSAGYTSSYSGPYTGGYGSSGGVSDPYLLRNRVTASNVYDYENPYDRYGSVNRRYAKGGEVKHFFLGGITNTLKSVLPYAGIFAAPFISSPAAAAGIGALASGFGGRSGSNFDMKRALMGGIAAYGASTVGAGLEAAGTTPAAAAPTLNLDADVMAGTNAFNPEPTSVQNAISKTEFAPKSFFRDTDAMQKGVGNLLSSDSDAASKAFATKAGTFKSGIPLVMGTTGMMAIDEANKMREEAELAAGPARQENADMLARIAKGKKRAEDAVRANPYMYAMGGQVDDELGGDYSAMGMDQGNMQKGLFGMGYAEGGTPRFLSGGGDGMSDSIPATIGGTQEARLADGEFVIPADVVSHLGNGSSKAGAKQLYSMMDRIRKARTGNEKQGRQIKPTKLMPA